MKTESQLREKLNHSLKTLHWKYRRKVTANNFNFLKVPAAVFIETNILCQQTTTFILSDETSSKLILVTGQKLKNGQLVFTRFCSILAVVVVFLSGRLAVNG